jgi:hypothetical protein
MSRYFTKTFLVFLICFLAILGLAFGVIIVISASQNQPAPVDNSAAGNA